MHLTPFERTIYISQMKPVGRTKNLNYLINAYNRAGHAALCPAYNL